MTAQMVPTTVVSEELLAVLQTLSPDLRQQVLSFAKFLGQQQSGNQNQAEQNDRLLSSQSWIEALSGTFQDEPEYDLVVAYGRAIRQGDYSVLQSADES